jgi:maleylacetoacetate isomerase
MLRLHSFHGSSTSFRVRIALNLKKLQYEYVAVRLAWQDGDHDSPEYRELNPQQNVPLLEDGDVRIAQSLAIMEYLDGMAPELPLFPSDPAGRARVLSIALHLACEIQPLNNLRVERYLVNELRLEQDALRAWRRHWIRVGFDAVEQMLTRGKSARFCHGDSPTAADCTLVPQVHNALRPVNAMDLTAWPTISRIFETCMSLPEFERAQSKHQPDYAELKGH